MVQKQIFIILNRSQIRVILWMIFLTNTISCNSNSGKINLKMYSIFCLKIFVIYKKTLDKTINRWYNVNVSVFKIGVVAMK